MADIEFLQEDGMRTLGYFEDDVCLTLKIIDDNEAFTCFWTPNIPPLAALKKMLGLGLIPTKTSRGYAELEDAEFETNHWREAFRRVSMLDSSQIRHFRLGTNTRSIVLERTPSANYGLCCGMGGELEMFNRLGTVLMLTAPRSLVVQYSAMHARLVGSR